MVDVNIGYNPYVKNTGETHDLIVGCSVFTTAENFVVDLYWFILYNMPAGASWQPIFNGYLYTGITGISAGNYLARCRAWKSYNLNPPSPYKAATKLGDIKNSAGTVVGAIYKDGAVYGDSVGDGSYLDSIVRLFTISGAAGVSMDLTLLDVNVA